MLTTIKELSDIINKEFDAHTNIEYSTKYLNEYSGNDWTKFVKFNDYKYNRIELFRNDNFEILLLCWNENQETIIHNHPKNGCIYKVVQGELLEKKYKSLVDEDEYTQSKYSNKDQSSYIDDLIGVHKISSNQKSVSIHIYSPPLFYK